MTKTSLAPPYSILFLSDPGGADEVPADTGAAPVCATQSCVSVWTKLEIDGETQVDIGSAIERLQSHLMFDGYLETPTGKLSVTTAELKEVLREEVGSTITRLQIWSDDKERPGRIQFKIIDEGEGAQNAS
ncbi:MAG: hypothetical protein ACXW3D_10340 [Caulobacteraceae bacterium]